MARRSRYKKTTPSIEMVDPGFEPIAELMPRIQLMKRLLLLMDFLSTSVDRRVTAGQILAFIYFANFDALGEPKTLNDLRKMAKFSNMITRSLDIFLEPEKEGDEEMLDWLYRETDPRDARNKFIRLTEKGRKACRDMTACIG